MNKEIALQWFAAFNLHDLEMLLELYDDNAVHYSPKLKIKQPQTGGHIEGKQALRQWWKDAFERLPDLQYEIIQIITEGDIVFMEYIRKTNGETHTRVGETLQLKNGKIIASRVYHS